MANTYTLIASSTVGSGGAANIEFTSIPATYTDLLVKLSGRDNRSGESVSAVLMKFNDETSNRTQKRLYGNGSVAASDSAAAGAIGVEPAPNATANTFGNFDIYIPNYASSNYKSSSADAVSENNATLSFQTLIAGLWSNTAAITKITISPDGGDFVQYSTAYLYGIKNS